LLYQIFSANVIDNFGRLSIKIYESMNKSIVTILMFSSISTAAYSEEFASELFTFNNDTVQYLNFNLLEPSTVDIAASSAFTDTQLFLFQDDVTNGALLASDDDSCLSVDCGLTGKYQFNPLLDNQELTAGDYTVALTNSPATEADARSGLNENNPEDSDTSAKVLLKVGDQNLIHYGEGTGSASVELKKNTLFSAILTPAADDVDNGFIEPNNEQSTAKAIVDLCFSDSSAINCNTLIQATPEQQESIIKQITPEELNAVGSSSVATSKASGVAVTTRMNALRGGAMISTGGGAGDDSLAENTGVFVNAQGGFGDKQNTRYESGYQFKNGGIILGTDYLLTPDLVLGVMFNYTNTENQFLNQSGDLSSNGYTGTLYSSYYWDNIYIDTTVGIGYSSFDMTRHLNYSTTGGNYSATAKGNTGAMQYMTSINAGYQYHYKGLSITPSIGLNYANTQVDNFQETGANTWNVAYQSQEIESLTTTIGTQIAYAIQTDWAILTPQLQGEWVHEFSYDAQQQQVTFVNDPNSAFTIWSDNPDRDYFKLGVNMAAQFTHSWSGFFAYNTLLGRNYVSNHSISAGIRLAF